MRMTRRSVCLASVCLLFGAYTLPAAAVEVGEKAPDFELPSTLQGKFKLSEQAGKKNVIIQFYVLDFTPT
jgi:peroxiredoxin